MQALWLVVFGPQLRAIIQISKRCKMTRKQSIIALGLILAVLAAVLAVVLLQDLAWCHENYAADRIPHCMWFENNIFGRFVQPAGVGG
jgi:hypothetical protein